eukprot:c22143_g2_i1 orf=215-397(-)
MNNSLSTTYLPRHEMLLTYKDMKCLPCPRYLINGKCKLGGFGKEGTRGRISNLCLCVLCI